MSCIFCNSEFHRSEFCEVITSDESRKQFLRDNNICEICIMPLVESDQHGERICYKKKVCHICFSRWHHSIFCPDRSEAINAKLFIPKIDANLVQKFVQTFDPLEQYAMAFSSSPKNSNLIKVKPLKVIERMDQYPSADLISGESNIILDGQIWLQRQKNSQNFFRLISSKSITIKAHFVYVYFEKLSPQDFYSLLTPFITTLWVNQTEFTPEIKFGEILEKIPNVQSLKILNHSNVVITNSWVEDLCRLKEGNNFNNLELQIENFDFNFEALAEFMKTKCLPNVEITLSFFMRTKEFEQIPIKLSEYFVEDDGRLLKTPTLKCVDKSSNLIKILKLK